MDKFIAGYKRFRANGWPGQSRIFESLAEQGQSPRALVLTCVDSRIDPALIFDAGPGEMLVVRNVANLAPPYQPDEAYHGTSAALEFGVRAMRVEHLIVLGHSLCGGARALLEGAEGNEFIGPWMSMAREARDRAMRCDRDNRRRCCEYEVVKVSLANLMTFPWIAEGVGAGKLALHGSWFDIRTGVLEMLGPDGSFAPVVMTRDGG